MLLILVALHAGLLQPVDMKLSVAGVDVAGLLPWLQRRLSNRRTLHFTVYSRGAAVQVFGSLAPLGLDGTSVRLAVNDIDGKAPPLDVIVDRLAHEIIRARLAHDASTRIQLLQPTEFVTLAAALVDAASANHRSMQGRPVQQEFVDLLPRVTDLCDGVPEWGELNYFAAWIADKARNAPTAIKYYTRVVQQIDTTKQPALAALVQARLTALSPPEIVAAGDTVRVPIAPTLDYTAKINRIRDSGNEGSVVGMALATALEFQILKNTHEDHAISARYIYYAAREAAGTTREDAGANINDGLQALTTKGAVEESIWPYTPGQFAAAPPVAVATAKRYRIADVRTVKGVEGIKRALTENGPVVAGINVYQSMMTDTVAKTGAVPLHKAKEHTIGGHAIVIVGYDDARKLMKFANSWGSAWGDHGFGYLPYEYLQTDSMSDAWTFKLATP